MSDERDPATPPPPEGDEHDGDLQDLPVDPDAPGRSVIHPDEPAIEPNEPA